MPADAGAVAAVRAALERVALLDPWLRAFTEVTADAAVRAAERIDRDRPGGALAGLPIAVKGRAGLRAVQTRRLVAAGAIPVGCTAVPRRGGHQTWGHTERGPTRNPWRPDLSPGGSSAGSAAAVGAGIVPLATGSDGAGSVRVPAAWCGIHGYKLTTGLASTGDPSGLAVPGPLARDPGLLRAWAAAVLGPLPAASTPRSVAWSADLGFAGAELDPEVAAAAHRAARSLAADAGLGWHEPPLRLTDPRHAWSTTRDAAASAADRERAAHTCRINENRLDALFGGVDLLATPATPGRPHGHDGPGEHLSVALTWAFNLSGHPAVSVPVGFTGDGAPVGLQLVARHHADAALLALVHRHCPPAPTAPPPEMLR